GTSWGLFRHYWVVIKLAITVVATIVLLIHMQPITHIAALASKASWTTGGLEPVRTELVIEPAVALLALLVATALSTYKPQGRTPYGQRILPARTASESLSIANPQRSNSVGGA
ncbi:MAG: DUF2269 domain-containing protein, partial [Leifsonia sp.]